jgi:hypothetical protein
MTPEEIIEDRLMRGLQWPTAGHDAAVILSALSAAGYVIVPREATEEMLDAGGGALADEEIRALYRAMIAASQGGGK